MEKQSLVLLSSEVMISEESKLDPVFLTVRFLLASDVGNLNNEGVTKAFIDDLVSRQEAFECLPVYVDMEKLLAGDYDNLTHQYNRVTRKFKTKQFGSLTNFYSETDESGVTSLYADARFPKRELDACMRLVDLYELGKLCVSVELRYNPEHTVNENGVKFIDAHEDNALTGLCIVSQPAERRAFALDLVAEKNADDSDAIITDGDEPTNRGETETMNEENITAEVTEEVMQAEIVEQAEAVAEAAETQETVAEEQTVVAEDQEEKQEDPEENPEDEQEEDATAETQDANAELLEHSVDTHESIEECPYTGQPVHVIEYHERIIETMEDAGALIAELDQQIAELTEIKGKYDAIIAEENAKALAEKQNKARAFAEKQGLDVNETAVAEAIQNLDYAKIAELTMAQVEDEPEQVEQAPAITLASYVDLEVSEDKYGGLLSRKNN